ncbi:MAG: DUF2127 domain-containing protein [Burkholderiaceae bacterium]|nr:MAG: DUF2127 domain-containing protein [Burkholderiaceae bacterium]
MRNSNRTAPPIDERFAAARRRTLKAIAAFEALKGMAALVAILGLLDLMHHDIRHLAIELIGRFHLDPDAQYASILLHYADLLPGANIYALMALASGYILVRGLEAYGLWYDQAWGEWLGALSGGLYIPFEFIHLLHRPSLVNAAVLMANVFVVVFLAVQLWLRRRTYR